MTSALSIASTGLHAAQLRLESSAHNVANLATPGFQAQGIGQHAIAPLGGVASYPERLPQGEVSLEREAVEQIAVSYAFKANALVLRTADDMLGSLLDVRA